MKKFMQFLLFMTLPILSTSHLLAQENSLNPDFLLFSTTPLSTQSSIYGLNGLTIQNGFDAGILNSNMMQVGSDLQYTTINENGFSITKSAQIPAPSTLLDLDRLTFKVQGNGQGMEEWKMGRDIDSNNPVSNMFTISREGIFTGGGAFFGVALYIDPDNLNVGIGIPPANDCKLDVGGTIHSNGNVVASDARFKENIRSLNKPMNKLLDLNGVAYDLKTEEFKDRNFSETKQLGLIAQELETVFPELVMTLDDGYKAINYDGLIPVLIEALKEEHAEQEVQKEEIKDLQNNVEDLQNEIQALKLLLTQLSQQTLDNTPTKVTLKEAQLLQNAPNPFNKNTTIHYFIPENIGAATLNISNMNGQMIKSIAIKNSGHGEILLEGNSLTAGHYVYTLVFDGKVQESRTMVLTK